MSEVITNAIENKVFNSNLTSTSVNVKNFLEDEACRKRLAPFAASYEGHHIRPLAVAMFDLFFRYLTTNTAFLTAAPFFFGPDDDWWPESVTTKYLQIPFMLKGMFLDDRESLCNKLLSDIVSLARHLHVNCHCLRSHRKPIFYISLEFYKNSVFLHPMEGYYFVGTFRVLVREVPLHRECSYISAMNPHMNPLYTAFNTDLKDASWFRYYVPGEEESY